jgi:hypothetical protein
MRSVVRAALLDLEPATREDDHVISRTSPTSTAVGNFVDKILKGTSLAIFRSSNRRSSRSSSTSRPPRPSRLTIPPSLLARADQVIEQ